MSEIVCVSKSVYRDALTRGKRYPVLGIDDEKRQLRIKGDNGRVRWFPSYCFDQSERSIPILTAYHLDDTISPDEDLPINVTITLSNGEQRWCVFTTPSALASCGDWIDGTKIAFHYGNRHIIVSNKLSEELVGRILKQIDSQGELLECTLPLEPGFIRLATA